MNTVDTLLVSYLLISLFVLGMIRREQTRRSRGYGILDSLAYVVCLVWPLPLMAMILQQRSNR